MIFLTMPILDSDTDENKNDLAFWSSVAIIIKKIEVCQCLALKTYSLI